MLLVHAGKFLTGFPYVGGIYWLTENTFKAEILSFRLCKIPKNSFKLVSALSFKYPKL